MPHRTGVSVVLDRPLRAVFVMTASFERRRLALCVEWVQRCGQEPPMLTVAVPKGHALAPLIQDSHCFGLSRLGVGERVLVRRLSEASHPEDPFDDVETEHLASRAPLLKRADAVFDCAVVHHLDLEGDHELYVGRVVAWRGEWAA